MSDTNYILLNSYRGFQRASKIALAKRLWRGSLNPLLARVTAKPDYDFKKSIVIIGGARSGTTWLAEIVNTIPRSGLIFEPLYLPKVREARLAGVQWDTFLHPDEDWHEGETFLRKVFAGKILNSWTTSFMSTKRAIRPEIWIIKMVRANMMLGWMIKKFPFLKPALLIRHPCSTILSMRQQGWPTTTSPPHLNKFESVFPHFREIIGKLKHPIEYSAALWCISYYSALFLSPYKKYIVICYERLVRDGIDELHRLFDFLEVDLPGKTLEILQRYSQMTKKDSPVYQGGDPLAKWEKLLSPEEVHMILNVVRKFGLDFYNEKLEPDYDRLYGPTPLENHNIRSLR